MGANPPGNGVATASRVGSTTPRAALMSGCFQLVCISSLLFEGLVFPPWQRAEGCTNAVPPFRPVTVDSAITRITIAIPCLLCSNLSHLRYGPTIRACPKRFPRESPEFFSGKPGMRMVRGDRVSAGRSPDPSGNLLNPSLPRRSSGLEAGGEAMELIRLRDQTQADHQGSPDSSGRDTPLTYQRLWCSPICRAHPAGHRIPRTAPRNRKRW